MAQNEAVKRIQAWVDEVDDRLIEKDALIEGLRKELEFFVKGSDKGVQVCTLWGIPFDHYRAFLNKIEALCADSGSDVLAGLVDAKGRACRAEREVAELKNLHERSHHAEAVLAELLCQQKIDSQEKLRIITNERNALERTMQSQHAGLERVAGAVGINRPELSRVIAEAAEDRVRALTDAVASCAATGCAICSRP